MATSATQPAEIAVVTVSEGNRCRLTGTFADETGAAIPLASLSTLTLTLYDRATDTVINGRDAQSILNVHGGTYDATSGAFTLTLGASDNVIVTAGRAGAVETHIALLEATWPVGGYWSGVVRVQVRDVHRNH